MRSGHTQLRCLPILIFMLVFSSTANAEGEDECQSRYTHYDVCAKASEVQRELAPLLPMQMISTMTLSTVIAVGPLLAFSVVWKIEHRELMLSLTNIGKTMDDLTVTMEAQTSTLVCGQDVLAAFVGLGGKIEYNYRTLDAVPITSITIQDCPE